MSRVRITQETAGVGGVAGSAVGDAEEECAERVFVRRVEWWWWCQRGFFGLEWARESYGWGEGDEVYDVGLCDVWRDAPVRIPENGHFCFLINEGIQE